MGKKISYRAVNLLAMILCTLGGLIPFFYAPNWLFVLVMRAILGIGAGFYCIRNPLLVKTVPPQQLAKYIGWGGVINNVFQIILNPLAGSLAGMGWRYSLLINGVVLVVGIFSLTFLREPARENETEVTEKVKIKIHGKVVFYAVMQFVLTAAKYPLISGMSTYAIEKNIGNATVAGYLISIYMVSGVVVNFLLPKMQEFFKDSLLFIAVLITGLGIGLALIASTFVVAAIGVLLCGVGFLSMFSMLQVLNGKVSIPSSVALGSTIILAANQLGVFASNYFIALCNGIFRIGSEMENAFLGGCIVMVVLAAICLLLRNKIYPD